MVELNLLFKLNFLPFHAYLLNDTIFLLGERIAIVNDGKLLSERKLKHKYKGSCILNGKLLIFTREGVLDRKLKKLIETEVDDYSCTTNSIVILKNETLFVYDESLKMSRKLPNSGNFYGGFLFQQSKGKLIIKPTFDTLTYELPMVARFYPNFVLSNDSFFVITGNTRRYFYMLFFREGYLNWYFRMSRKTLPYGIDYLKDYSALLIYGTSRRTLFAEMRSIEGDVFWTYYPRVVGIALVDEAFRGYITNGESFYFYGYSEREGDRRAVIKQISLDGEVLKEWISDESFKDVLFMFNVKGKIYAVVLGKRVLGFYEVKL